MGCGRGGLVLGRGGREVRDFFCMMLWGDRGI